jgi:hypothetical protein
MTLARWVVLFAMPLLAVADDQPCAQCHRDIVTRYRTAAMSQALVPAAAGEILKRNPDLTFREPGYESHIRREGDRAVLTVAGGVETLTANLLWAFGRGQAGQTYVFERDGTWYESRISYFNALHALDLTMGAPREKPKSIEYAAGHRMSPRDAMECFGCHATGSAAGGQLHLDTISPGVGCESCHGSAARHVAAIRAGDAAGARLPKLDAASTEEISELCGRCHRTWSQIASNGPRGVLNVRFQPYRLTNSRCYSVTDARIRCTACHDPHGPLETSVASYDSRCTACHSAKEAIKICKVGTQACVTCHMPKVELPGAHARFTDHQIRIARASDPYPN